MNKNSFIVVSDSHGLIEPLNKVYDLYKNDIDLFFHCGDAEVSNKYLNNYICINGNNGYDPSVKDEIIYKFQNHNILLVHGHRHLIYGVEGLVTHAKNNNCDIVLFGHTHRFLFKKIDGVTLINPGSLNYNRDNTDPSYAIVTIDDNIKVKKLYI